ncbi:hypothetical protein GOP47_0001878 [Adiantum capillus-veneris]|uniref:Rhodanese domain-containing protein n=1 Tax=Adiantum capillus-veneris TaxID=13818 RepID=A0A9D4ZR41_ADICA|nr:hypothetical protein GOP47_0001878 [Adiantum capillus-veneris]
MYIFYTNDLPFKYLSNSGYSSCIFACSEGREKLGRTGCSLFSAIEVALVPFLNSIVRLVVQLSKGVAGGLILPTEKFLQSLGFDTKPVVEALKIIFLAVKQASEQICEALEPLLSNVSQTRLTTDHLYLIRAVVLIGMSYFLVLFIIQMLVRVVRGYKGELSSLEALDMVLKRGHLLIDVRTEKEKFKAGIPSLPENAMKNILFVPIEDLSYKFKGKLRDYRKAEAEVAPIKISYLRRINKSSKLVILDRYGDVAKLVARKRLGSESTSPTTGLAQMFSPTRLISEGAKRIFPSARDIDVAPQMRKLSDDE